MAVTGNEYSKMADQASPPSHKALNTLKAFLIGGLICVIGQGLNSLYLMAHLSEDQAKTTVSVTLIALTAILTAFGVFDKIARHAGAGTIVPITGFANAVVSPAMEFQSEGRILGTGAQIFSVAGPVILYGPAAAVLLWADLMDLPVVLRRGKNYGDQDWPFHHYPAFPPCDTGLCRSGGQKGRGRPSCGGI